MRRLRSCQIFQRHLTILVELWLNEENSRSTHSLGFLLFSMGHVIVYYNSKTQI